jgi:hypothetical protein
LRVGARAADRFGAAAAGSGAAHQPSHHRLPLSRSTGHFDLIADGSARASPIVSGQHRFAPDELATIASRFIPLDHDQRLTPSAGASHTWRGTTPSADALVRSGLRRGYVNSDHLPSYLTVNAAAHRGFAIGDLGAVEVQRSALNALDRVDELRDGSGVGVGVPQSGMRRTRYLGISKPFGR